MRQDLKELMRPIKAKDPEKVAEERERRKVRLKEQFGVADSTTDTEYLKILIDELFMQIDKRGAPKGPRLNATLRNLKLLVKISFRRNSGRAKNLVEAAEHYGMSESNLEKQKLIHKGRWREIQNKMSEIGEKDINYRKTCQEKLSRVRVSLENLVADRGDLARQRDKLTAQEADLIDLKDEEIFLHDHLIGELEKSCRYFDEKSTSGLESLVFDLVDKIFVSPE